ncbi:MAG: CHAT domain-containing protein [Saprospiraceae bacterium]|uniref:CHAT domain-containing protein n=1 Tax=Candidatus Defluviibacterium haderslevense TaxID=2981993 RepID=A0A9D7XER0_9BACT|nr:CHAT domain-containing protein [Candidatus Defluviibacterium haderslevense]
MHFATHGFYNSVSDKLLKKDLNINNLFTRNMNPLMRSGILMANANETWVKKKSLISEIDGVLTALEISNLNLNNTMLVVLSACDSGLGDLHGNEGVYGLQRGFKLAGVKFLVLSLWQVGDEESKIFMENFYKKLVEGMEIHLAFNKTQKMMRNKYKDIDKWGAWVLI